MCGIRRTRVYLIYVDVMRRNLLLSAHIMNFCRVVNKRENVVYHVTTTQWRLQDLQPMGGSGVATSKAGGPSSHPSPQMNAHVGLWGRNWGLLWARV